MILTPIGARLILSADILPLRRQDQIRHHSDYTGDERSARQRAHESNIARYRRLLETRLSDVERHFIEQRLVEEQTALSVLAHAS